MTYSGIFGMIVFFAIALACWAFADWCTTSHVYKLQNRAQKLGNVIGRSYNDISAIMGPYQERRFDEHGQLLITWTAEGRNERVYAGYTITLIFHGDQCAGIAHEQSHHV
jgi:hypothetical protein